MFCDFDKICECLKALLIVLISFIVVTVLTINIVSILLHMRVFIHTSCIDLCHYQKMVHNGPPMHNLSTMLVLLTSDFSQLYSVKIPLYCGMTLIHIKCHKAPKTTGLHLPYGITQCYLPPYTSERAPPNQGHAGWYSIYLPRRDGRLS